MNSPQTKIRKIPKLRFRGFSDEWRTLKLNEAAKINPKVGQLPENFIYIDLDSVKNGRLLKQNRIKKQSAPSRAQRQLQKNDIIFQTVRPYQRNNFFFDKNQDDVVASTGYAQIRTKENPHFLYQFLHTNKFVNDVLVRSTGTNYPAINSNDLAKITVNIPDPKEQEKIAGFLATVDYKISSLEKKKDLLEKYKKGVMQKIFPPAGGQAPQIRFKGFSDKWEENIIGDIAYSETSPLSANQIEGQSGQYKVYGASGVLQTLDTYHYEDEYIAIVKDGAGVGRISICEPKSSVLGTMIVVQPKKNIDKKFLYYLLNLIDFKKYTTGSTIPHVYFKQYSKEKLKVPNMKEQQKIANFLTALDDKIELENKKLQQAKLFKKSLLQKMFV